MALGASAADLVHFVFIFAPQMRHLGHAEKLKKGRESRQSIARANSSEWPSQTPAGKKLQIHPLKKIS
jgi:hypothetical protein